MSIVRFGLNCYRLPKRGRMFFYRENSNLYVNVLGHKFLNTFGFIVFRALFLKSLR